MNDNEWSPNDSSATASDTDGDAEAEALRQILNARGEGAAPMAKSPELSPKKRAGYTTNKGRPRNKARARMAKVSRVRNRR